jgi:glycosyltransferase involved in cell wall biosynthesis
MFQPGIDTSAASTTDVVVPLVSPGTYVDTGSVAIESAPPIDLRVLHVVNGEHFSGAERVQSHLGRCLPAQGVAADFASVKPGKFAKLINEQEGQWGTGYDVPMSNRFDLRAAWNVRDLALQNGYDVLHAHTPRTAMIASVAARLANLPWVYHVHSPAAHDSTRKWINRMNAMIENQSLRGCSHLITVSESLRCHCVAAGIDEGKVTVVHNGVPAICPPRDSTPTPGGRWTIGMVALMRPRKGLEIVLDALSHLQQQGHDVVLRVIGPYETDDYESQIKQRIEKLAIGHRVEEVGFTKDVPAALAQLDAMVLPSLFGEGLPMVVLEAMAAGLPVIATRVEGTPEAITDRVEGLLAEPRDPVSLANKIADLVSGNIDWHGMSRAAVTRHKADFSDVAMARGTSEVYRTLVSSV